MIQCIRFFNNINETNFIQGEIWLAITESVIPNIMPYYSISNYGRIYSHFVNRIMSIQQHENGYCSVQLSLKNGNTKRIDIHRLVKLVFDYIPDYEKYDVNHKDGIKTNNMLYNLEWSTHSYNLIHAYETELHSRGGRTL